jgi:hypothetical protein
MNYLGLAAAATAFLNIWIGHVAVRKVEFYSQTIWLPTVLTIALGLFVEFLSLSMGNLFLKTMLGITGTLLLWDALELARQQHRVKKGHAPANPNNPRHLKILSEHHTATALNGLNPNPLGSPFSREESLHVVDGD